jgi:hypothetical protein
MERKPWKNRSNRRLPKRFQDLIPQGLPFLPPPHLTHTEATVSPVPVTPPGQHDAESSRLPPTHARSLIQRVRSFLNTKRNAFGLFRRYETTTLPEHDPEENISPNDLSDIATAAPASKTRQPFYPYPNRSSFLLGDWFWNGGVQKSQESFKDLLNIIANPEFSSSDIRNTQWDRINRVLGSDESEHDWFDEDAGWITTPVTISIPHQNRRGVPHDPSAGPRDYTIPNFWHRNLLSVIREKISNASDSANFHYRPYELHWQPDGRSTPIRTHGELYTSPTFIEAHERLQDSPPEPDCTLERVVVAMIFSSDVTQLTSFGTAKVWPLYLFFGNESKYRRSKPSCGSCEHVAYFQKVRIVCKVLHGSPDSGLSCSYPQISRSSPLSRPPPINIQVTRL